MLTFDVGLADLHTSGLPALQGYGFAATLYVTVSSLGGASTWLRREGEGRRAMLSWSTFREVIGVR